MRKNILMFEIIIRSILPPFYSFSYIERVCKNKLDKRPNDPTVLWLLGYLYFYKRKNVEAQYNFEALIDLGEGTVEIKKSLSCIYYRLDKYKEVEQILRDPEILSEKDEENYYLGYSLIELEKFKDSINYLKNYIKHHPEKYEPFVYLGNSYAKEEMYDLALDAYREAEKLNPLEEGIKDNINLCIKEQMQKET